MKDKKRGVLAIVCVLIAIALCAYGTLVGFGKAHKLSAKNIRLGLDLDGGVSITYQTVGGAPSAEDMKDTISMMEQRAEVYSTESSVVQENNDRVVIDIPGAKDAEKVLKGLGKEGSLEFVSEDDIKKDSNGNPVKGKHGRLKYDKKDVIVTGKNIKSAEAGTTEDETTKIKENVVNIEFDAKGTKAFGDATEKAAPSKKIIYILYDGKVLSAPAVQSVIDDGKCQISGSFDKYEDAEELAKNIRIGALPVELKEVQSQVVDAQLGNNALQSSLIAGVVGFILVVLFMVIFYRIPGLASSIALVLFLGLYLLALNGLNVTLTLPGIAGVLLNIGMAVDANVIIFSRIREELAGGKTVQSAIKIGFNKALSAILDGNITTLIAAAVLYIKGSGTVRGFAITLAIGIVISLFTALTITRLLLNAFCVLGINDIKYFGVQKKRKSFDFVGKRNIFFSISTVLIVGCIVMLIVNANSSATNHHILNYGLEFVGGTNYKVTFNSDTKINNDLKSDVEKIMTGTGGAKEVSMSQVSGENALTIHTTTMNESHRDKVTDALVDKYDIKASKVEVTNITGSISGEMRSNAIIAVVIAAICMLLYIAIRFKDFVFAGSAVLALIHDITMVLFVYAASRIAVGSTFIAVMLTILGYSINSTIVIFDRVREKLKGARKTKEHVREIVNQAVTDTLSRSINTNLTTFFMLVTLVIFGVNSIREFAVPLMVGIIAGCYSSVFITAPLWYTIKAAGLKSEAELSKNGAVQTASGSTAEKKISAKNTSDSDSEKNGDSEPDDSEKKAVSTSSKGNTSKSSGKGKGSKPAGSTPRKKKKKKKGRR